MIPHFSEGRATQSMARVPTINHDLSSEDLISLSLDTNRLATVISQLMKTIDSQAQFIESLSGELQRLDGKCHKEFDRIDGKLRGEVERIQDSMKENANASRDETKKAETERYRIEREFGDAIQELEHRNNQLRDALNTTTSTIQKEFERVGRSSTQTADALTALRESVDNSKVERDELRREVQHKVDRNAFDNALRDMSGGFHDAMQALREAIDITRVDRDDLRRELDAKVDKGAFEFAVRDSNAVISELRNEKIPDIHRAVETLSNRLVLVDKDMGRVDRDLFALERAKASRAEVEDALAALASKRDLTDAVWELKNSVRPVPPPTLSPPVLPPHRPHSPCGAAGWASHCTAAETARLLHETAHATAASQAAARAATAAADSAHYSAHEARVHASPLRRPL